MDFNNMAISRLFYWPESLTFSSSVVLQNLVTMANRVYRNQLPVPTGKVTYFVCNLCVFFFSSNQSSSESGHKRTDSNYSTNSSEFSQSLGSTEGEDSPIQTEVM